MRRTERKRNNAITVENVDLTLSGEEDNVEAHYEYLCGVCNTIASDEDLSNAIICEGKCNRIFHLQCVGLAALPEGEWECPNCIQNTVSCYHCKRYDSPEQLSVCTISSCNKYYHPDCIRQLHSQYPKASPSYSNYKSTDKESFICPRHVCDHCDLLKVKGDSSTISLRKYYSCALCVTAYHKECFEKVFETSGGRSKGRIPCNAASIYEGRPVESYHLFDDVSILCHRHQFHNTFFQRLYSSYLNLAPAVRPSNASKKTDKKTGESATTHFKQKFQALYSSIQKPPLALQLKYLWSDLFIGATQYPALHLPSEGLSHSFKLTAFEQRTDYSHIDNNVLLCESGAISVSTGELPECHCVESCDADICSNRLTKMECHKGNCHILMTTKNRDCGNQRLAKRKYSPIEIYESEQCGIGVKATDAIKAQNLIIEYVGEVISKQQWHSRSIGLQNLKNRYALELDSQYVIDANKQGNYSRFINHSCNPNCYAEKWISNNEHRIGIFALRDIEKGEALTFDYRFATDDNSESFECLCGSANCSGVIGKNQAQSKVIRTYGDGIQSYRKYVQDIITSYHDWMRPIEHELLATLFYHNNLASSVNSLLQNHFWSSQPLLHERPHSIFLLLNNATDTKTCEQRRLALPQTLYNQKCYINQYVLSCLDMNVSSSSKLYKNVIALSDLFFGEQLCHECGHVGMLRVCDGCYLPFHSSCSRFSTSVLSHIASSSLRELLAPHVRAKDSWCALCMADPLRKIHFLASSQYRYDLANERVTSQWKKTVYPSLLRQLRGIVEISAPTKKKHELDFESASAKDKAIEANGLKVEVLEEHREQDVKMMIDQETREHEVTGKEVINEAGAESDEIQEEDTYPKSVLLEHTSLSIEKLLQNTLKAFETSEKHLSKVLQQTVILDSLQRMYRYLQRRIPSRIMKSHDDHVINEAICGQNLEVNVKIEQEHETAPGEVEGNLNDKAQDTIEGQQEASEPDDRMFPASTARNQEADSPLSIREEEADPEMKLITTLLQDKDTTVHYRKMTRPVKKIIDYDNSPSSRPISQVQVRRSRRVLESKEKRYDVSGFDYFNVEREAKDFDSSDRAALLPPHLLNYEYIVKKPKKRPGPPPKFTSPRKKSQLKRSPHKDAGEREAEEHESRDFAKSRYPVIISPILQYEIFRKKMELENHAFAPLPPNSLMSPYLDPAPSRKKSSAQPKDPNAPPVKKRKPKGQNLLLDFSMPPTSTLPPMPHKPPHPLPAFLSRMRDAPPNYPGNFHSYQSNFSPTNDSNNTVDSHLSSLSSPMNHLPTSNNPSLPSIFSNPAINSSLPHNNLPPIGPLSGGSGFGHSNIPNTLPLPPNLGTSPSLMKPSPPSSVFDFLIPPIRSYPVTSSPPLLAPTNPPQNVEGLLSEVEATSEGERTSPDQRDGHPSHLPPFNHDAK